MKTPHYRFLFALMLSLPISAVAETLQVDAAKSWLRCDCKATGHSFQASLTKFKANVVGDPATLKPSATVLSWDFGDLKTNDDKRDKKMLEWLEYTSNATGKFEMSKFTPGAKAGEGTAEGKLTIHGVKKIISVPVTAAMDNGRLSLDGSATINSKDFNLPIIRMLVMTVKPEIKIVFHLEGPIK